MLMVLNIFIISTILIAVAGIGLGIKYYNEKSTPSCARTENNNNSGPEKDACDICGADRDEKCKNDQLLT
jgi:hypothetical protein